MKKLARFLGTILVLGVVAWLADSLLAARTENAISEHAKEVSHLETAPTVYISGFPFSAAYFTEELPKVSIGVSDVIVPTFGMVRANTTIGGVDITRDMLATGEIYGTTAQLISRDVGLDGVALGELLDIDDLDLSHPSDISPSGGVASSVLLRGTPAGYSKPVSVLATLRLKGPMFYLTPQEVFEGASSSSPSSDKEEAAILDAFRLSFDTTTLPLGTQASYVYLSGGTIFFQAQERNVTIEANDLSPIAVAKP